MRRTCRIGLTLALACEFLFVSNAAKADHAAVLRATLTGPGLATPIVFHGADIFTLAISLGIVPAAGTQAISPPAPGDLGPRFNLSYYERLLNGRAFDVHQTIYPYAVGRPWAHTPPGQRFWSDQFPGFSVRSGWWNSPATDEALKLLERSGLPPLELAGSSSRPSWWLLAGGSAGVGIAGAILLWRKWRRRAQRDLIPAKGSGPGL
jgi:hypothetical protein